jgi:four helix bundle protein
VSKPNNIIQDKSYKFAVEVVKTVKQLRIEIKEYHLTNQLIKSATSIGANVEEAIGGQSERDFIHKISIAYKEARETKYWLRILNDTDYITGESAQKLIISCDEIIRILTAILNTMKLKK